MALSALHLSYFTHEQAEVNGPNGNSMVYISRRCTAYLKKLTVSIAGDKHRRKLRESSLESSTLSSNLKRNAAIENLVDDSATNIEIILHHVVVRKFWPDALKSKGGLGSA